MRNFRTQCLSIMPQLQSMSIFCQNLPSLRCPKLLTGVYKKVHRYQEEILVNWVDKWIWIQWQVSSKSKKWNKNWNANVMRSTTCSDRIEPTTSYKWQNSLKLLNREWRNVLKQLSKTCLTFLMRPQQWWPLDRGTTLMKSCVCRVRLTDSNDNFKKCKLLRHSNLSSRLVWIRPGLPRRLNQRRGQGAISISIRALRF